MLIQLVRESLQLLNTQTSMYTTQTQQNLYSSHT